MSKKDEKGQFVKGSILHNKKPLVFITCIFCQNAFQVGSKLKRQKFCNRTCANRYVASGRSNKTYAEQFGERAKEIKQKMSNARKGRTWAKLSPNRPRKKAFILNCQKCNKKFTVDATTQNYALKKKKYCSRECAHSACTTKESNIKRSLSMKMARPRTTKVCQYCKKTFIPKVTPKIARFCSHACFSKRPKPNWGRITKKYGTKIEILLESFFLNHKISYQKQVKELWGRPDFLVGKRVIFADGCYWHGCKKCFPQLSNKQIQSRIKDIYITQKLQQQGYTVIRLWEHDILKDVDSYMQSIIW